MEITLSDILRIFRRWKWLFSTIFLLAIAVSILVYKILPEEYEISTVLKVSGKATGSSIFGITIGGEGGIEDYIQMMKSREVLKRVIEKYNLIERFFKKEDLDRFKELGYSKEDLLEMTYRSLREKIEISPLGKSSLVKISYRSGDADLSYDIVKGIVEEFKVFTEEMNSKSLKKKREFLEKKLEESYENYRKKLKELVEFQKKHGVVSPQDELITLKENLLELEAEVLKAKLEEEGISSELKDLISEISKTSPDQNVENAVEISKNITSLESQLAGLKISYPEDHVKVRSVKAQVDFLKNKLETLMKDYEKNPVDFQSLTRNVSENLQKLREIRFKSMAGKEVQKLLKDEIERILDLEEGYILLQNEMDVLKNVISFTWQQYLSTVLDEIANVSKVIVVSPPVKTRVPTKVSLKLVGAVGGAIGFLLASLVVLWVESAYPKVTDHRMFARSQGLEDYRIIRKKKLESDIKKIAVDLRKESGVFLVVSPNDGDGKSSMAFELAKALSTLGKRVLLIDGDVHEKELTKRLKLEDVEGLSDGKVKVVSLNGFDFVPAGKGERVRDFEIPDGYDIVLMDSPSYDEWILDVSKLSDVADGFLILIAEMNSSRSLSSEILKEFSGKKRLVVFNKVRWSS